MLNDIHLSRLIESQAQKYGDREVLSYRADDGKWKAVTWNEFAQRVQTVSRALVATGLKKGECIAVFSQNMPECHYAAFGGYGVGVSTVPFYATSSGAQVAYMMNDAEVRCLFVGEQAQYDTAIGVVSLCRSLEKIVIFDRRVVKKANDTISIFFDEFAKNEADAALDEEINRRKEAASFDDIADILYTSGTTGNSKGVMLTHKMYRAGLRANANNLPLSEDDVVLNFLPFTHVFERGWTYLGLAVGVKFAVNRDPHDVLQSLGEVKPTCMCSVPRFWEKVYEGVREKMDAFSGAKRKLMESAVVQGMKAWREYGSKCEQPPLALRLRLALYEKVVYKTIRKMLGLERANFFPTAGAAVAPEVEAFAHAIGIYMMVGYGLTESTATVSNDNKGKPNTVGSIGRPLPGVEVRIGEQNEIQLRGDTITPGYFKKETSTKAVFTEDGWFRTGDAGYLKDGELYLTDRIKDLFKTSNGKYIAPQMIESKLTVDRFIEECVVVADKRKFVSALIVPNYELLEQVAKDAGQTFSNRAELCSSPIARKTIADRIDTLQQDLAHYEQVKQFILLPEPFTMENGMLTNTLKVKRSVVYERYALDINHLYEEAERKFKAK